MRRVRLRVVANKPLLPGSANLADVTAWCDARAWPLGASYALPEDSSRFAVVWKKVRAKYLAIAWAVPALLERVVLLVAEAPDGWSGFVAQLDYTCKVAWHDYDVGCLGLPICRFQR